MAVENPLPRTGPLGGRTRIGRPAEALARYSALPLAFEPYPLRTDEDFRFVSRGVGQSVFLSPAEIRLVLGGHPPRGGPETLRIRLLGANVGAAGEAGEELKGRTNYIIG